jgi:hypothetical protein
MGEKSERDKAIDDLINQELIAEGRDDLQAKEKSGWGNGGGGRGGATNDLDNTP